MESAKKRAIKKAALPLAEPINPDKERQQEPQQKREAIKAVFLKERVMTEDSGEAKDLYNKSRYGKLNAAGKVQLSLTEAYYLLEKGRMEVMDGNGRSLTLEAFANKARRIEPNFWIRYCVYKDFRDRGYIIKTALKFGADFRVYERGIKPGDDHAKWIVYPVHEASTLTWYEFAAKNRVAHSTKKRLMIAVVDDEDDVSFWEVRWTRP